MCVNIIHCVLLHINLVYKLTAANAEEEKAQGGSKLLTIKGLHKHTPVRREYDNKNEHKTRSVINVMQ